MRVHLVNLVCVEDVGEVGVLFLLSLDDHSRVVLCTPDEKGSDYINASFIDVSVCVCVCVLCLNVHVSVSVLMFMYVHLFILTYLCTYTYVHM